MQSTSICDIVVDGREFLVKRDDLFDPFLAGNKFRKLYTLLNTPKEKYTTIISYGGTQSNAMLAIAALCQRKSWNFLYYTKPLSQTQKNETTGNYVQALSLGMIHKEIENDLYKDFISSLRLNLDPKSFIIDQGGAVEEAQVGLRVLAQEIEKQLKNSSIKALATPSGTGTTALFLAKFLPQYKVYTVPCIGDTNYLREQMSALSAIPKNLIILNPSKKYHFAKPYPEFIDIYKKLKHAGIEFDLLYAPGMWKALLEQTQEKILYIHSGGVSGNGSMLQRYSKKGMI